MPEHTSWFTYLVSLPGLQRLAHSLDGKILTFPYTTDPVTHQQVPTPVTLEFVVSAIFVILLIVALVLVARARVVRTETAVLPEGKLTVASFMENFVEVFYGMLKDTMGPRDARAFLPVVGTCAVFIFFSNALGMIPGFVPPTSNFNVTLACGLVVFFSTHYYGLKRNGVRYLKHFLGPVWWLSWFMLPLEIISHLTRPISLALRLMVNMFVDHLVVGLFTVIIALVLPVPIMLLGILVVVVQTYVFCLLATAYIAMAVEHHDEEEHADVSHAHEPKHGHEPIAQGAPLAG